MLIVLLQLGTFFLLTLDHLKLLLVVGLPVFIPELLYLLLVLHQLLSYHLAPLLPAFHQALPGLLQSFPDLVPDDLVFFPDLSCFIIFLKRQSKLFFFFGDFLMY